FSFHEFVHILVLISFPTRRSSDLYRLDFAEGGCAIPEGAGDEFLGALRAINLFEATGQMHRLKKDWVRPIGWYDLRFGDGRNHKSEEHTSELQSRENLVCRLLLEK